MTQTLAARINPSRVIGDLTTLRHMGAFKTGVHRPTLSKDHIQSLNWLAKELPRAGLEPTIDGIANVFGVSTKVGPKLLAGSHLESQNEAGWLDGPLGVVYALEAARVLNGRPGFKGAVEVAAWCDEEGHFGNFLGSASYVGDISEAELDQAVDRTLGRTLRGALAEAGYAGRPRVLVEKGRHIGYLEAHIEQGDWLEAHELQIGVVTSIVGIWQFRIVIEGTQNHAGTTRMAIRRDAGLSAVKLLMALDEAFKTAAGPRTVWTTGRIALAPGAPSIIPGRAEILFQFRDDDLPLLQRLEALLREVAGKHNAAGPCPINVIKLRGSTPARMDERFQAAFENAAKLHAGAKSVRLPSGAGHDAQVLSAVMPAAMMFVPSIGGISHHWTENTSDADIIAGAQVFATACESLLMAAAST
jgi:beta-ureidopropionase / N-carbamoyl-L-amino-acid hydrolase